jgi:hypothetical protein
VVGKVLHAGTRPFTEAKYGIHPIEPCEKFMNFVLTLLMDRRGWTCR